MKCKYDKKGHLVQTQYPDGSIYKIRKNGTIKTVAYANGTFIQFDQCRNPIKTTYTDGTVINRTFNDQNKLVTTNQSFIQSGIAA